MSNGGDGGFSADGAGLTADAAGLAADGVGLTADGDAADIAAALQAMPAAQAMGSYLEGAAVEHLDAAHVDGRRFADLTTLRLGGPCADIVVGDTQEVLISETSAADTDAVPLLLVAGGSNLVVADAGWSGRALLIRTRGIHRDGDEVTVAAGEPWDEFVAAMVAEGRGGLEALSGIPGRTGATPIQNVGAYGQEVAETITGVLVWDRRSHTEQWLTPQQCEFGYRTSLFKRNPQHHLVLAVRFRLPLGQAGSPVRYAELADALGIQVGEAAPLGAVREAVLKLRSRKGMVLDPDDHDTWSAGSFFTNPILTKDSAAGLPSDAPRYPQPDGSVKTSAAWLIEQAGITKGFALRADSRVAVSSKHTLALTNRGGGATDELLELARFIRGEVYDRFGVTLQPEPVLVDCHLP